MEKPDDEPFRCPPDVWEFGARHGIPNFAEATYLNGYRRGLREAKKMFEAMQAARQVLDAAISLATQDFLTGRPLNAITLLSAAITAHGQIADALVRGATEKATDQ